MSEVKVGSRGITAEQHDETIEMLQENPQVQQAWKDFVAGDASESEERPNIAATVRAQAEKEEQDEAEVLEDQAEKQAQAEAAEAEIEEVIDESQEATETPPDPEPETPGIDPYYRQAGRQLGLSDEEVDAFWQRDPEAAAKQLDQIANSQLQQILQMAQLGNSPVQGATTQQSQSAASEQKPDPFSDPEKLQAWRDEIGGEFVDTLLADRQALKDELSSVMKIKEEYEAQQQQNLTREIGELFDSFAGFEDVYGKFGDMTDNQFENRQKVGVLAGQIAAGAEFMGVPVSTKDAFAQAHMVRAAEIKAQRASEDARTQILDSLKGREKTFTAKPSRQKSVVRDDLTPDQRAEQAVARKLDELGESWNDL